MAAIALLLAAAAVAYGLARALNVAPVPVLLVTGLVAGQLGVVPGEFLEDAIVLGVTILLFLAGTELDPGRTRGQRGAALRVGLVQFFTLAALGIGASVALGFDLLSAGYMGLALTASSTLVTIRLLARRRQMFEPVGRLVVGVLLLQDLLVILLIPLLTRLPQGPGAVAQGLLAIAVLTALTYVINRRVAPLLLRLEADPEPLLLAALAVLFAFMGLAWWLDLPLLVGAFLAGVAMSGFPVSGVVRAQLESVGDFFTAIFFTALGAVIAVPPLGTLVQALILAAVVIVATPPLVTFVSERAGLSARPAIEAGLLLSQTSEISLVIGLYGVIEGQLSADAFTVIAVVTLLTMFLTPGLSHERVAWRLLRWHPAPDRMEVPPPESGHVLLLGSGSTGMPLLETLLTMGNEVAVVDDDPAVIGRLAELEVPCVRGEAADEDVLERVNAPRARVISSTIRRPEDNRRLLQYVTGVPVIVRVFDRKDAEWIRAMGGTPVLYSEAAAAGLFRWYDQKREDGSMPPPPRTPRSATRAGPAEPPPSDAAPPGPRETR